ncbi:MAG: tRNA (N(6)-L-threonylcarbamoyladenosine(37)-C(2))-methylthiotransferase MtaB [Spirochaetota bacterium]|nr:tRNA (N(6)-L-threonylcarbamoyladenosine(37)-C(2))-methylthiotransferase MtaB [Spirochaetota bacterium]
MYKTFSIKTLGCKLNQYESSVIASRFIEYGWIAKPFGTKVDVVIINTCTVTDKSDKKCRNYIRQGSKFSKSGKTIVIGCLAERDPEGLKDMDEVLMVFRNNQKDIIFSEINKLSESFNLTIGKQESESDINHINSSYSSKTTQSYSNISSEHNMKKEYPSPLFHTRGYIKIQDGCDGQCTYCIVPSVRGKPVSRSSNEILEHARRLIDTGCPELIFTGITIGKYIYEQTGLAELIEKITKLKGQYRIRLTSLEPNHITDRLIEVFDNEKVCPHLHIPLQSGSDKILQLMKRPYSVKDYMKIINKIRSKHKNISIGTDIIIGFPGEDEDDFRSALETIKESEFAYIHQFTFSPRSNTPASKMKQTSPPGVIRDRSELLRKIQADLTLKYRTQFQGKSISSVIEKNRNKNGFSAVSDNYIRISLKESSKNKEMAGKICNVKMIKAGIDHNIGYINC